MLLKIVYLITVEQELIQIMEVMDMEEEYLLQTRVIVQER
jgi:hypothetical protein